VLGYDDTQSASIQRRLTSVHIPMREVTVSGLNCLLIAAMTPLLPVQREFPINVTWRASVAMPPGRALRRAPSRASPTACPRGSPGARRPPGLRPTG